MTDSSTERLNRSTDSFALDAEAVAEFLQQNPDFFEYNQGLLNDLVIPHQTGQSVSLIERQVSSLRKETEQLKLKLSTLIANAHANDELFEKTKALVLALLDASNYGELKSVLEQAMRKDFNASACALWRIDQDDPTLELLSQQTAQTHLDRLIENTHPYCGLLKEEESNLLFQQHSAVTGSAAVLPLSQDGALIGILAIANQDKDYYRNSMSTQILSYIGDIVTRLVINLTR